jgi:glutamine amidotransferase-like uncharacterized protein
MKIFLFLLSIFSLSTFGQNTTVHYEPEIVELVGHLDIQTFPGIPNYESIKNGDKAERHFYLKLQRSIDVIALPKDDQSFIKSESFYNVQILQLVVHDDKHMSFLRKTGEGGHVKIRGTLFHRHTGHHHSRVLLEVENIKKI